MNRSQPKCNAECQIVGMHKTERDWKVRTGKAQLFTNHLPIEFVYQVLGLLPSYAGTPECDGPKWAHHMH